ncbi:BAG family molecular chaperone regulator 3 [Acorus calamus]|uniref:BAG family molecular chaperone regulator 3 n=1 Tax=Acorus calamus TaxID=4465 RepID=A0AAV9DU69_ACOCL|nr:BAG family molecular chaperone regulator 3 [Acorus calamus]
MMMGSWINGGGGSEAEAKIEWEVRPGGMLVQKRTDSAAEAAAAKPNLRVRVVHGAARYEISVNSQSTFGELKKVLAAETGLEAGEQRLLFRGKERENRHYLDLCGVKNRSKIVLQEDPLSKERRFIEMRRNAKIQTTHRAFDDISSDVDKLTDQVSAIEKSIASGIKVAEVQITTLTEMLMRQAIKLDSLCADGELSSLKNLQSKRVQKCVETLDMLKVSNASAKKPVVVTTDWETFDAAPVATAPTATTTAATRWEFFD